MIHPFLYPPIARYVFPNITFDIEGNMNRPVQPTANK